SSMIDYIIVSDNIVIPGNDAVSDVHMHEVGFKSDVVVNSSIPVHSMYIPKSCNIWTDYSFRIDDHFLVSCQLRVSKPKVLYLFRRWVVLWISLDGHDVIVAIPCTGYLCSKLYWRLLVLG